MLSGTYYCMMPAWSVDPLHIKHILYTVGFHFLKNEYRNSQILSTV